MSINIVLDVKPEPDAPGNDIITWVPVPGAGVVRLKAGDEWVSSSFDGTKHTWRVKRKPTYELATYGGLIGVGHYPAPVSTGLVPMFNVTITPNWVGPNDPGKNYNSIWCIAHSPTTPWKSPDSQKTSNQRYLLLDPRVKDENGIPGQDEWWFIIERSWPSSFDPNQHGAWGRLVNFHNVAGDAGPNGGVGWGFGAGTSGFALDWLKGQASPTFAIEPYDSGKAKVMPVPNRNEVQTYLVHFIAGRIDGTTPRKGLVTIWANGQQIIDLRDINTVQKAKGPDGVDYVQRWMQLWEGDYTEDLPTTQRSTLVLTRMGKTKEEAIADRPYKTSSIGENSVWNGQSPNQGKPSLVSAGDWDISNSRLP